MNNKNPKQQTKKELPLDMAASLILDESRMILPGIQALFGFQLIVVFNDTFTQKLNVFEQRLHLLAIVLVVITTVIIMTQAMFHRQTALQDVEEEFIRVATRLLLISMFPLMASVCLEFYLICRVILNNIPLSVILALGVFAFFLTLWIGLPRSEAFRHLLAGTKK